jgi:phosphomevalonate kinase
MSKKITAFAPGKMYILGEYAVVHPGHPSILVSLSQGVFVTIIPSKTCSMTSSKYRDEKINFSIINQQHVHIASNHDFSYVKAAIEIVLEFATPKHVEPFAMHIESQLDNTDHQKYGFGSSAAILVATITAFSDFLSLSLSQDQIFKLAVMAQLQLSSASSFGDIACSVYQGTIYYVKGRLNLQQPLQSMIESTWDGFVIEQLPSLPCFMLIGYSNVSASSTKLVNQVNQNHDHPLFEEFLSDAKKVVNRAKHAIITNNCKHFLLSIDEYRSLLVKLQQLTHVAIEIPIIETMISLAHQANVVAKTSGAGGGDCVIAFASNIKALEQCRQLWEVNQIEIINHSVSIIKEEANE